jgi:AraC-like DNA-binding protein
MLKKRENLFKSVMMQFRPKNEWQDFVYLAEECKERFLSNSDLPEMQKAHFHMAGLAELSQGYQVERENVSAHTLLFTLEGAGVLITKDQVFDIPPNTLTILPAHQPFRFEIDPQIKHWKMIWMLLEPNKIWQGFADKGQCVVPYYACEQMWSLLNLLHVEIDGRPGYRRLLVSEAKKLLTGMETQPLNSVIRVQTLFNEIESQLHLPWTIAYIAERCFISEEQLNRICKSLYGKSPQKRLIELRMDKAVKMLTHEAWSIAMIAPQVGYKDPYNFTHRFKKHHGVSPRQFRQHYLQSQGRTERYSEE